jgi:NADH-quinone oxidoreductase subunit B
MHGILKLRKMIQDDPDMGWRERYEAGGTEEIVETEATAQDSAANVFREPTK